MVSLWADLSSVGAGSVPFSAGKAVVTPGRGLPAEAGLADKGDGSVAGVRVCFVVLGRPSCFLGCSKHVFRAMRHWASVVYKHDACVAAACQHLSGQVETARLLATAIKAAGWWNSSTYMS